ncbi:MAG: S8 family serine peptidase, partial [Candidatus Thermoplasmatota archaeon]|nr:S8 family serine peptidase [Candidatus Thermoplasmatota archaeon]
MPDPACGSGRALWLLLCALLVVSLLAPAAGALEISTKAIKVAGSNTYNPHTVQTYAGEVEGGPPAFDGQGMAIAVLDTGVDDQHPALQGSWVAGAELRPAAECPGESACWRERDPIDPNKMWNPDDLNGHGTHVASIALGRGASSETPGGQSLHAGVAPGASMVEVKIANDLGGASLQDIAEGIRWVIRYNKGETQYGPPDPPVKVISLSMGTVSPKNGEQAKDRDVAMTAISEAWDAGILTVVSAGNCGPGDDSSVSVGCDPRASGQERNTITSPGAAPEALTVGATDDRGTVTRNEDHVAGYSSRGPNPATSKTDTKWRKPDVVAPGTNIAAACYSATDQQGQRDAVCTKSGTSMAAPHVAGVAAILFQAGEVVNPSIGFTAQEVKDLITGTSEDWEAPGWDAVSGYGYVDAYAALVKAVNRPPKAAFTLSPGEPEIGQEVTFDASASEDPDDQDRITRFLWDFGDGSEPVETSGENRVVHHVYQETGHYTVTLTVEDARATTATTSRTIQVVEPPPESPGEPPEAQFTWSPEFPRVHEEIT